ncbi:ASAP1 isoform 5 [Pan troglodytes]|uniref:ArfGAP with SH3 domain, ankyrin repeat and PH domain 1 n=3 Tax=Hominidae TaxID=9604 RepID=E5RHA9_HUMAN|nr:ASAP1 isoform 3 [Pan troglodytes]PNJ76193.1 ASAP1 isoform 3 [Pongo abelii]PNI33667.1 ASAP1 isoform 4 [Pan troglodytes]PNI33668.1 ASAP1 isoform 5 [Pan troglodytes]PNJ76194.1 ASAP1 isoform 4 [Pongo abelii]
MRSSASRLSSFSSRDSLWNRYPGMIFRVFEKMRGADGFH